MTSAGGLPNPVPPSQQRLLSFAAWLVILFGVTFTLIKAKDLLIPLVLAVFIWYLINLMVRQLRQLRLGSWKLPTALQYLVGGGLVLLLAWLFMRMLTQNIGQVVDSAGAYQANVERLLDEWFARLPFEEPPELAQLVERLDFGQLVRGMAGALGSLIGSTGLIFLYLLFLFLEQRFFHLKMQAIFRHAEDLKDAQLLLARIDNDVATYLGIKTLVSLLTALLAFAIMTAVGLDFAAFWAVLVFILNFIPNIGSVLATVFPALLALLQFESLMPFWIIALGITSIQLIIGNLVEPNLMGRSLNISPLVVILSLVIWGTLWGIPGMFLCVPITVIAMIILYRFDSSRWLAMMLSKTGNLAKT